MTYVCRFESCRLCLHGGTLYLGYLPPAERRTQLAGMETPPAGASLLHPLRPLTAGTYYTERAVVFGLSFAAPWIRKLRPCESRAEGEAVCRMRSFARSSITSTFGFIISWGT